MKIDPIIAHSLITALKEVFPELPEGKFWSKYNKDRIYFNHEEIEGYTFFIDFEKSDISTGNFDKEYWLDRLKIESEDILLQAVWKHYYLIIYPKEEHVPINTISDIERFATAEVHIITESKNAIEMEVLPFNYTVLAPRDEIDEIFEKSKSVHRVIFNRNNMDKVISELARLEDEEDAMYMQQLQATAPKKIAVDIKEDKREGIVIDEGVAQTCAHCGKEFTYYDEYTEFCSTKCKEEYTHVE